MKSSANSYSFLFTDVEGSTRLWDQYPEQMSLALAHHNDLMTDAIESNNGTVFKTVGDGFCAIFDSAADALQAAISAQKALAKALPDAQTLRLKVRMGLHYGPAEQVDDDYFGPVVNHVARLTAAGNGGQILISATFKAQQQPASGVDFRDLGAHKLRDLAEQMHIFQVIIPDFPNTYTAIRTLSPRPTNLPVQLSSFVGREAEVEAVSRRMRQPEVRLLTLFGPGGIGKTRLSLQVGAALRDEYEDGVFFVGLSPITSENGLLEAIASALQLEESTDTPLLDTLKNHLESRQILIILDNFEQVVDFAPVLNDFLSAAAQVKILVTSREELLIYGEQIYPLAPLSLPDRDTIVLADRLMDYSAISLFMERVRAVRADFVLDEANAADVIAICRCLDGLPLAIELASVRIREFELSDILAQLTSRLEALTRGARDLPARQRTIRGAIDWSYDLLLPEEKAVFMRMGVFVGPFTVEAADSIAGIEYLNRLKEKSLVQQLETTEDGPMFVMLETLREYALEYLAEAGETDALRNRHLDYYRELVERAEPNLTGIDQMLWFRRLEAEWFNIQSALEWALKQDAVEQAGSMVAILWRYWGAHSRLSTGRNWIGQVLAHVDRLPPLLKARVRQGAGRLAFLQARYDESTAQLVESATLYEQLGETEHLAAVNLSLGETSFFQGDMLRAEHYFQSSLVFYQEAGDMAGFARCLAQLGRLAQEQSNPNGAESLLQQSLEITREYGSTESIALAVNDLAETFRMQGKFAEAAELYQESLGLYKDLGFDVGVAVMLHNLAQVTRRLGDVGGAQRLLVEAISLLQSLEEKQVIAECFAALGAVYVELKRLDFAVILLSAAQHLMTLLDLELTQADQQEYQVHLKLAESRVDAEQWATLWARGQALPLERLVADILQDEPQR